MRIISHTTFTTVKTEGAILPADLLQRIATGQGLDGLRPDDYHLAPNERLNEAINRSWNRCLGAWASFNDQRARLPESDAGTTLTRERWLLILFQELGYGRLQIARGVQIQGTSYPISHLWSNTPIHLVSFRQDLDRRDGARIGRSPHSLVQEYLNRAPDSLWGFVSNGLRLRVLRDNVSLTRAAYVEFDLEAMLNGELYADFSLLWLICHQSRVEAPPFIPPTGGDRGRECQSRVESLPSIPPTGGDRGGECWLERWSKEATEQGARALDALRDGVQEAIGALGRGFLAQPANRDLKAKLKSGELTAQDYYRQLLRLVYRLIFLFVAEDRDLLLVRDPKGFGKPLGSVYMDFYSAHRLRHMAEALRGGPHADLYRGLRLLFVLLRDGYPDLALPALGSFLFSDRATPDLDNAELPNGALLEGIRALAFTTEGKVRRPVDYKNLGSIELGSVYESLLELHPILNADAATFDMQTGAGNERKTTGSHYTHPELVKELIESALEPVIAERLDKVTRGHAPADKVKVDLAVTLSPPHLVTVSDLEHALLNIKICDPACGSGHFLVAAAYRLARRLASVRTGDDEPSPDAIRSALRDVVGHCLYGVDINPMAVELCKVSLWLEALEPGKPLSFLDHHIQCGNSLIGATPALLARGIPDEAFTPIEGDVKKVCAEFKKRNKKERQGARSLFDAALQPWERLGDFAASMTSLDDMTDDTLEGVRRKQARYEELVRSSGYEYGHLWADAWCAAFVWKKTGEFAYPITEEVFRQIERNPFNIAPWMRDEIKRLREQYQFFHWHLAFPDVFGVPGPNEEPENEQAGWSGGFDCVLGNPPWEELRPEEKNFFFAVAPHIALIENSAQRQKAIEALESDNLSAWLLWQEHRRQVLATAHFLHASSCFPLSTQGNLSTSTLFVDLARQLLGPYGWAGLIVPSGLATNIGTSELFKNLVMYQQLQSMFDFENRRGYFPAIDSRMRFSLVTLANNATADSQSLFGFFLNDVTDIRDRTRIFALTANDIARVNPDSFTCPVFRTSTAARIVTSIHAQHPIVSQSDRPAMWKAASSSMFQMSHEADLLHEVQAPEWIIPLVEGKMVAQYNHRAADIVINLQNVARQAQSETTSVVQLQDPFFVVRPRYWVAKEDVDRKLHGKWDRQWLIQFCAVTSPTNERTCIVCITPRVGAGHSLFQVYPEALPKESCGLVANLNSYALDFVLREKMGGINLSHFIFQQLPVVSRAIYSGLTPWMTEQTLSDWIVARVVELTYAAWDLQSFAQDCGYDGPPFRWGKERRFLLRCELDAAYFHLYGIARDDVDYIMETFPIVKRKDEAAHGEYRTKRVILEIYDAMQRAKESGQPFQTLLDPPPADARVAHITKQ